MNVAVKAENLTRLYGKTKAVDGLTLEVAAGEFFGFLGPNGAGKTTTIRLLTGIIKPNGGKVTINGNMTADEPGTKKIFGVVPESRGFYEWMTAEEYLAFFAPLYCIPKADEVVAEKLSQVGLSSHKNSRISTFSRGMKQRLGLARALINDPRILFLDEPTLGLDPQGQEDIQNLLKELNRLGVTVFFSSHLLNEVTQLCSRVAIINHGKLAAQGTMIELQEKTNLPHSNLKDIFLKLTSE